MAFDSLIANPGRLQILTALAASERQEFVGLRRATRLTDGNLSAHARKLAGGGLVGIEKHFRDGKPVTTFVLTAEGRRRLTAHAEAVLAAVNGASVAVAVVEVAGEDEDWVD